MSFIYIYIFTEYKIFIKLVSKSSLYIYIRKEEETNNRMMMTTKTTATNTRLLERKSNGRNETLRKSNGNQPPTEGISE